MKFFFPDSQDQIAPDFDFLAERHSPHRLRQLDDHYAHEALAAPAYDGVLVSKTIVDGFSGTAKYSDAQRRQLHRLNVRGFFRLDHPGRPSLEAMGDCGAFTYRDLATPPYTVDEVLDFYEQYGFDYGVSVDHVILCPLQPDRASVVPGEFTARQALTLELAADFLRGHRARNATFTPLGVAQGWSPGSYAGAVAALQCMGYQHVAVGGMVPLKTRDILKCLAAIDTVRDPATQLHLLGITRCDHVEAFAGYGVSSFDSTSPFRQAFKDDSDNYYTLQRPYTALRVPQLQGNTKLNQAIAAGAIDQRAARNAERHCLDLLRRFERGEVPVDDVLEALATYETIYQPSRSRIDAYRETLEAAPWRSCTCGICAPLGVQVAIFRGAERNKRRGFHNLAIFRRQLVGRLATLARPVQPATAWPSAAQPASGHDRAVCLTKTSRG